MAKATVTITAKLSEQTVKPSLKLPGLSVTKPSERAGKLWQRLLWVSAAKPSEWTGKPTEIVKTR